MNNQLQTMISDLSDKVNTAKAHLRMASPKDGCICVSEGDFLVRNFEDGPFVVLTDREDGSRMLPSGPVKLTGLPWSGSFMSKRDAETIADCNPNFRVVKFDKALEQMILNDEALLERLERAVD